jgi:hypothetical protein
LRRTLHAHQHPAHLALGRIPGLYRTVNRTPTPQIQIANTKVCTVTDLQGTAQSAEQVVVNIVKNSGHSVAQRNILGEACIVPRSLCDPVHLCVPLRSVSTQDWRFDLVREAVQQGLRLRKPRPRCYTRWFCGIRPRKLLKSLCVLVTCQVRVCSRLEV